MAFRWHADDGPTLNAGLLALCFFRGSGPVLLTNPIFFLWFFRGGGDPDPLSPPFGSAYEMMTLFAKCSGKWRHLTCSSVALSRQPICSHQPLNLKFIIMVLKTNFEFQFVLLSHQYFLSWKCLLVNPLMHQSQQKSSAFLVCWNV